METILIHVSEFGSWVGSSRLNIDLQRIIAVNNSDLSSFSRLLDAYGNVRISEPEAYILVRLKNSWRQSIFKASNSFAASKVSLDLEAVLSFQALTLDAELRLNSQTERLSIKLTPPEFETLWRNFQSHSQLQEVRECGAEFLSLYSFTGEIKPSNLEISDLVLSNLLARVTDYKSERKLESLKGLAEYGPTEFGMRISAAYNEEWRNSEERYVKFREIRSKQLTTKSWNDVSPLDFPDLRESILSFDLESRNILGIPPLAAVSYFNFYAEYILQGKRLNLEAIKKTASDMLALELNEDCFNFLYILGCSIGAEQVAAIKYRLFQNKYPVFREGQLSNSHKELDSNLFEIYSSQDVDLIVINDDLLNAPVDSDLTILTADVDEVASASIENIGLTSGVNFVRDIPPSPQIVQQELIPAAEGQIPFVEQEIVIEKDKGQDVTADNDIGGLSSEPKEVEPKEVEPKGGKSKDGKSKEGKSKDINKSPTKLTKKT
jgi:hypothetical protein